MSLELDFWDFLSTDVEEHLFKSTEAESGVYWTRFRVRNDFFFASGRFDLAYLSNSKYKV